MPDFDIGIDDDEQQENDGLEKQQEGEKLVQQQVDEELDQQQDDEVLEQHERDPLYYNDVVLDDEDTKDFVDVNIKNVDFTKSNGQEGGVVADIDR